MSPAPRSARRTLALLTLSACIAATALTAPGCSGEPEVVTGSPEAKSRAKGYMNKRSQDFDERRPR